jgi:23S rRNA (pseudouridine1915-N3)-methyltransferase
MRGTIRAVGRLKAGPERILVDQYLERASAQGRACGLGPFEENELDPRRFNTRQEETAALSHAVSAQSLVFALDETGQSLTSHEFAQILERARDDGVREAVFLIGGADGHARESLPRGARLTAFGKATWPHKLVRVMLAEQIYRAVSLIAGSPYHREG